MALAAGTRIGSYEVVAPLGAGGMGEVYRARDTRLKREVALKILPESFASDPDRLARFQREAEVLATLNHPHIAAIYGIEDGPAEAGHYVQALVLELVEGETLADRIARGAIPVEEALPIARQIAEALEAAHEQGIIHRDLKPANIKITSDGVVKVLDFGLAKLNAPSGVDAPSTLSMSPTITSPALMTGVGMILGTAAYMAPEQAKGRAADKRSDVWAFGCVLFEMLTGRRAFPGDDMSEVFASILAREVDWTALPTATPAALRRLLHRCLQKDRKRRLADMADARLEIDDAAAAPVEDAVAKPATRARQRGGWIATALASVAAAALAVPAVMHLREDPAPEPQSVRFQIPPPGDTPAEMFTLSPDGRQLAFIASAGAAPNQLWVRDLGAEDARVLPGTERASYPFWSPDGAYLGFFAEGKLKKILVAGGPAQTITDAVEGRGGTWNRDGVILFAAGPALPLMRVSSAGGSATAITSLGAPGAGSGHRFPQFLPDGVHYLYTVNAETPETRDQGGLYVGSLEGTAPARLLPDLTNAVFVPGPSNGPAGHLLFRRDDTLMAEPFDSTTLRATGEMVAVAEQVPISQNLGFGAFAASQTGTLAYRPGAASNRQLQWVDRSGKLARPATMTPALFGLFAVSPDQRTVAVTILKGNQSDIWLQDVERDIASRLSFRAGVNQNPVWDPDGTRVVFNFRPNGANLNDIVERRANGGGEETLLLHGGVNARVLDWSSDRKWLVYAQQDQKTRNDLWLLPLEGERKPMLYLQTPFEETNAQFAPAAGPPSWIAYQSDESGENQIYIQSIPPGRAKYHVSKAGGAQPHWRGDARELYYRSPDGKLMAVAITLGATVDAGTAHELFTTAGMTFFAPSADGQRFLINVPANGEPAAPPITVILNWAASLKK